MSFLNEAFYVNRLRLNQPKQIPVSPNCQQGWFLFRRYLWVFSRLLKFWYHFLPALILPYVLVYLILSCDLPVPCSVAILFAADLLPLTLLPSYLPCGPINIAGQAVLHKSQCSCVCLQVKPHSKRVIWGV